MNEKQEPQKNNPVLDVIGDAAKAISKGLGDGAKVTKVLGGIVPEPINKISKGLKIVGEAIKEKGPDWVEKAACGTAKVVVQGAVGGKVIAYGAVEGAGLAGALTEAHPLAMAGGALGGMYLAGKAVEGPVNEAGKATDKVCHAGFDWAREKLGLQDKQRQQQEAQQKAAQAETAKVAAQNQAANLHAERWRTQQVIANNRYFNLPYNNSMYQPTPMHLVFQAQNTAQFEFRLRYGRAPSFGETLSINSSISSYASMLSLGCNYNMSCFSLGLMATNLVSSYNSYHGGYSSIYSAWGSYGDIGGVAGETAIIIDLINSEAHAAAKDYYLCMPAQDLPFAEELVEQIQQELNKAYFEDQTLPFFSLHFNQQGFLYPIIHPAYQNTLIGEIIGLLDYWMKGYLNGGIFDAEFLKLWHETANCDEQYLRSKMTDLKKYCKDNALDLRYISLRELECRYGVESDNASAYKQPFMTSFRIIAYQEKIERYDNILIPHPTFKVEYSVDMMPDYKQYVESYQKEQGCLPPNHERMLQCYELFAREVKEKMPQLPFCRDFFKLLGLINSMSYFYKTLEKMGKRPIVSTNPPQHVYNFPKSMPPIPVRYYQHYKLPITFEEALKFIVTNSQNKTILDDYFSTLFANKNSNAIPETLTQEIRKQIELITTNFLINMLPATESRELNAEEIERIVSTVSNVLRSLGLNQAQSMHKELNSLIDEYKFQLNLEQKSKFLKLNIPNKIQEINTLFADRIETCTKRWDEKPELAYKEIFNLIPAIGHQSINEVFQEIEREICKTIAESMEQTKAILTTKITEGKNVLQTQQAHLTNEINKIPLHLRALNQANINNFTAQQNQVITSIQTQVNEMQKKLDEINKLPSFEKIITGINVIHEDKDSVAKTLHEQMQQELHVIFCLNAKNILSDYCERITKNMAHLEHLQKNYTEIILKNTKLCKREISSQYIHTFLSFSGLQVQQKTANNFQVVGGCGLQVPNLNCQPIAHGETFAEDLEKALLAANHKKAQFEHNGISFVGFKLPVCEHKKLVKQDEVKALKTLEQLTEQQLPTEALNNELLSEPMDRNGSSLMHYALVTLAPSQLEVLLKTLDLSMLKQADNYGNLPIHLCAKSGQVDSLILMLKLMPTLVDVTNQAGLTPLMQAVQYGQLAAMELLISKGANVNYTLPNGLFPLYMAMQKNFTSLALKLLEIASNLELNKTLDSLMTALHLAIQSGEPELALRLVEKGASCVIKRKSDGYTAFHCAAIEGEVGLLKAMLAKGVDVNLTLESQKTPLHLAAASGKLEAVELLVGSGAILDAKTLEDETPLMLAICAGHVDVALWLAQRCAINQVNKHQMNASSLAMQYSMPCVADVLISRGEDPLIEDNRGFSYLYYVLRNGEYHRFVNLLNEKKLNIKHLIQGNSYLAIAGLYGHIAIVEYLLKKNAPFVTTGSLSLLECAIIADDLGLVRKELAKSKKDLSALALLAIENKSDKSLSLLLKNMPEKACADKSLLIAAVISNHEGILELVLKWCKDINLPLDNEGNRAIHLAVSYGAHFALPKLVQSGCHFSQLNKQGQTPFHIALVRKDDYLLECLFKLSPNSEWPQNLGSNLSKALSSKMVRVLEKYLKNVPSNFTLSEGTSKLAPCPLLTEAQLAVLTKFKSSLSEGDFEKSTALLNKHPILITILKSMRGGALLQKIFANIYNPALVIEDELLEDNDLTAVQELLSILVKNKIQPENYLGFDNVLITIIATKEKEQALYKFNLLALYFPNSLVHLAQDKLDKNMTVLQLSLVKNQRELFKRLDAQLKGSNFKAEVISSCSGLHTAVISHDYALAKELLATYPVNCINDEGQTPLMLAALNGNISLLDLLLKQGANVNQVDFKNQNALHYALQNGQEAAALVLLPLLKEVNQPNRLMITPLMLASAKGLVSVLRFLCEAQQNLELADVNGHKAIHYGAIEGQVESIDFLVSQGFDVDEVEGPRLIDEHDTSLKRSALHLAALHGKKEALLKLLELNANFALEDLDGFGLCEYAIASKNTDLLDLLKLSAYYDLKKRGTTLLAAAVMFDNKLELSQLILNKINTNGVDKNGQTALHLAAIHNSCEAAELLLMGGDQVLDAVDVFGKSPIHYAAEKGDVRLLELLAEAGANLEQLTNKGESALFLAGINNKSAAVLTLLKSGADIRQVNQQGLTTAQASLIRGHVAVVRVLLKAGDKSLELSAFENLPEKDNRLLSRLAQFFLKQNEAVKGNPLMSYGFYRLEKAKSQCNDNNLEALKI